MIKQELHRIIKRIANDLYDEYSPKYEYSREDAMDEAKDILINDLLFYTDKRKELPSGYLEYILENPAISNFLTKLIERA